MQSISSREGLPELANSVPHLLLLLWAPCVPCCSAFRAAWAVLAAQQRSSCFAEMRSEVASAHFDALGLPAAAAYRAGSTVASYVRLQDELCSEGRALGEAPEPLQVAAWLQLQGQLPSSDPR